MRYQIINKTKNTVFSEEAVLAEDFFFRLIGFMFKRSIPKEKVLIFPKAFSIHTFFMFTCIDVIFLDKNLKVIKIYPSLRPWRIVGSRRAFYILESCVGKIKESLTEIGDFFELIPINKICKN
jgi:hypothetical protein